MKYFLERDFVGVSHSALLDLLTCSNIDRAAFFDALIAAIQRDGATHNQRGLLMEAVAVAYRPLPIFEPAFPDRS